jgi:hypothetical protein
VNWFPSIAFLAGECAPRQAELSAVSADYPGMHERPHINRKGLALISLAIALVCIVVLTLQVRDRWNSPEVKSAAEAQHTTTGQAARQAGARISQSEPKPAVEPDPAGPKPAQPAHPD